jgi:hypothetical protein
MANENYFWRVVDHEGEDLEAGFIEAPTIRTLTYHLEQ